MEKAIPLLQNKAILDTARKLVPDFDLRDLEEQEILLEVIASRNISADPPPSSSGGAAEFWRQLNEEIIREGTHGMKLFGYRIIKEEEYKNLCVAWERECRLGMAYRWFSGWKDLEVIWNFIFLGNGKINEVREEYAKLRGTDEYGKPIKLPTVGEIDIPAEGLQPGKVEYRQ